MVGQELYQRILFEDNHHLAINKLASEIVQGDKTGDPTLPDAIKAYLKERDHKPGNVFCGVIHRLDRPTSGLVLFAKTSKALRLPIGGLFYWIQSLEIGGASIQIRSFVVG